MAALLEGMPPFAMANNADFVRTIGLIVGGVAYNLTGHLIEMEVRSRPAAAETYISIDNDELGGIVIESPSTAGVFTFRLEQARLLRMDPGDYYYDVILTRLSDDFKFNLGINTITLTQGITR